MAYNYLNKVGLTNLWGNIKAYITSKLSSKAEDNSVVHLTGNESIDGTKTFTKGVVYTNMSSYAYNDEITTNAYGGWFITDKNNSTLASLCMGFITGDNANNLRLTLKNKSGYTVGLKILEDGSVQSIISNKDLGASSKPWGNVYATTFVGALNGNATSATLATNDGSGNVITSTYQTKLSTAQLAAANSRITSSKVTTYDAYAAAIGTKANSSDLTSHTTNNNIHVTSSDKSNWNNKSNFSGSYTDLTNKPTIPTVNNAILTIQKNGTTVKTFSANASANTTANITVPTKTSDLTNDSGFINNTDNCVHLTGNESIDGRKYFDSTGGYYSIVNRESSYAIGDTPTSNVYKAYPFVDKNNANLGVLQYASRTTGVRDLSLYIYSNDGSKVYGVQININREFIPIANNSYSLGASNAYWKSAYINSMNSANITLSDANFLRCTYGSYGSFWRQDGNNLYLMLTNKNDQYGHWNSFRPIQVSLSTGKCYINGVDPSASSADVVGKTITAYYTTASLSGRSDRDFSGNETRSFSTKTNTITPTVGTIYSGAQLYAIAVGSGSWSKSGNVSENNIYINQVLNSLLEFTGQYSSSAKYLCTTAQGVYNTSSGSSTLTNYSVKGNSSGGYKATGTFTNGTITNTIGGGKSTFLRVQ